MSDVAPILGENRAIAQLGLERLRTNPRPGIAALLAAARVAPAAVDLETVGFVLEGEGLRAGYAADLGEATGDVAAELRGCHVLALEFNHDVDMTREGPYPWALKERILGNRGHLSNEAAAALLSDVVGPQVRRVVLTHLSRTNNAESLAVAAARTGLQRSSRPDAEVEAAPQDRPVSPLRL